MTTQRIKLSSIYLDKEVFAEITTENEIYLTVETDGEKIGHVWFFNEKEALEFVQQQTETEAKDYPNLEAYKGCVLFSLRNLADEIEYLSRRNHHDDND